MYMSVDWKLLHCPGVKQRQGKKDKDIIEIKKQKRKQETTIQDALCKSEKYIWESVSQFSYYCWNKLDSDSKNLLLMLFSSPKDIIQVYNQKYEGTRNPIILS